MQNAINGADNRNTQSGGDSANWTGKTQISNLTDIKNLSPEDIKAAASELTTRVRDVSTNLYSGGMGYVRSNPVPAALGMAAVGFLAGMFFARRRSY